MSADDQQWLCQNPPTSRTLHLIDDPTGMPEEVLHGMTAIKTGGHFPGSLVLHWERKLFIADSIVTVPVGPPHDSILPNPLLFPIPMRSALWETR